MRGVASPTMAYPRHSNGIIKLTFLLLLLLFSPLLSASVVDYLPGFEGPLPFYLETGYVGVDEVNGAELFYYFIESERNPKDDPLLVWFSGGPYCSAFSGLAFEIGPLKFVSARYNGSTPKLIYHPYSWTKVSNIIFVDSPAGAGFSFSRLPEGYNASDSIWSHQIQTFITKWHHDHPRFIGNPLYFGGDSYAGKIVPIIVQQIADGLEAGMNSFNLKGYLVGNPGTGDKVDENSKVPYAHGMAIISDDLFKMTQRYCEGQDYRSPTTERCAASLDTFNKFTSEIEKGNILEPHCADPLRPPGAKSQEGRMLTEDHLRLLNPSLDSEFLCKRTYGYGLSYYWANTDVVRQALRIKKGTVGEWLRCNRVLPYTADVSSSLNYHLNVATRGYRALVYSGDHDMIVPYLGSHQWIKSFNFKVVEEWRSWHIEGQVAGYVTAYSNNLTFATVKGGSHTAPETRPGECLAMFDRWVSNKPL